MGYSNKPYRVVFTFDAIFDVNNIVNYISRNLYSPNSAKKFIDNVTNTIDKLKDMPKLYRTVKIHSNSEIKYRRVVINNYIIIYTIDEKINTVYILNIYYGKRNYLL